MNRLVKYTKCRVLPKRCSHFSSEAASRSESFTICSRRNNQVKKKSILFIVLLSLLIFEVCLCLKERSFSESEIISFLSG